MQRIDSDLSVGTLGLRVVRTLQHCDEATATGLASDLHASPARLRGELEHLASLGIVFAANQKWRVSVEGSRRWRKQLEGRLLGAA